MTGSRPQTGVLIDDVDTPALVLDLDVIERNIEIMHSFFRNRPTKVRNVTKGHRCPEIAKRQMRADGSVPYGLACSKVSEAEVMVEGGARDIRMIEQVVGRNKVARLLALAKKVHVIALADDMHHVHELSAAAEAAGVRLDVMIEIEIGLKRCGVLPGESVLALARVIAKERSLRFAGIGAHEGTIADADRGRRIARVRERVQRLLNVREDLERDGLPVEVCGAGSTTSWNIAGVIDGITEIDPGSYVLMDAGLAEAIPDLEFSPAISVLGTVISHAAPDRAVIDCGHKALGRAADGGMASVVRPAGAKINRVNSEHGILDIASGPDEIRIGQRVSMVPRYHGSVVVAYDYFVGIRGEKVECVWDIAARGSHQ